MDIVERLHSIFLPNDATVESGYAHCAKTVKSRVLSMIVRIRHLVIQASLGAAEGPNKSSPDAGFLTASTFDLFLLCLAGTAHGYHRCLRAYFNNPRAVFIQLRPLYRIQSILVRSEGSFHHFFIFTHLLLTEGHHCTATGWEKCEGMRDYCNIQPCSGEKARDDDASLAWQGSSSQSPSPITASGSGIRVICELYLCGTEEIARRNWLKREKK